MTLCGLGALNRGRCGVARGLNIERGPFAESAGPAKILKQERSDPSKRSYPHILPQRSPNIKKKSEKSCEEALFRRRSSTGAFRKEGFFLKSSRSARPSIETLCGHFGTETLYTSKWEFAAATFHVCCVDSCLSTCLGLLAAIFG